MGFEFNPSDFTMEVDVLPDEVLSEAVNAMADIVVQKQQEVGQAMGVHREGVTLGAIRKGKTKSTQGGVSITVWPQGTRSDNGSTRRIAEVAFVNNYGKRGQPPRPFVTVANAQCEEQAAEAAEAIIAKWLEKYI